MSSRQATRIATRPAPVSTIAPVSRLTKLPHERAVPTYKNHSEIQSFATNDGGQFPSETPATRSCLIPQHRGDLVLARGLPARSGTRGMAISLAFPRSIKISHPPSRLPITFFTNVEAFPGRYLMQGRSRGRIASSEAKLAQPQLQSCFDHQHHHFHHSYESSQTC